MNYNNDKGKMKGNKNRKKQTTTSPKIINKKRRRAPLRFCDLVLKREYFDDIMK